MKTVVRYSNRKHYDLQTHKYVNVSDLAKLQVGTFRVTLHGSGKDITWETLLGALGQNNVAVSDKKRIMQSYLETV